MIVGPADSKGIVPAERDFQNAKIFGNRLRIQELLARELIDAHSTAAVLTHGAKGQHGNIGIGPLEFQETVILVDSNVGW